MKGILVSTIDNGSMVRLMIDRIVYACGAFKGGIPFALARTEYIINTNGGENSRANGG
jgi:hypothetical protein